METQRQGRQPLPVGQVFHPQCAWCLKEAGRPMGNGSHGICQRHKAAMLAARRATVAARSTQKPEVRR